MNTIDILISTFMLACYSYIAYQIYITKEISEEECNYIGLTKLTVSVGWLPFIICVPLYLMFAFIFNDDEFI